MMMEAAGTIESMVLFLMVLPHEATLHTDHHQNYICGRRVKKKLFLKGLWTKTNNSNFIYSIGRISTANLMSAGPCVIVITEE